MKIERKSGAELLGKIENLRKKRHFLLKQSVLGDKTADNELSAIAAQNYELQRA
jgi:hypothetical protein